MPSTKKLATKLNVTHDAVLMCVSSIIGTGALRSFLPIMGNTNDGEPNFFIPEDIAQKVIEKFTNATDTTTEETTHGSD